MNIYLYNTLTEQKERFDSIIKKKITMYVCGLTVYDDCHIGHARTQIVFDIFLRYFRFCGYNVIYVRNITDIDDKIIKRASKENTAIDYIVYKSIKRMYKDFDTLNIIRPNFEPKATASIPDICKKIKELINNNYAYIAKNKDVYFRTKTFKDYGKLSKQNVEKLKPQHHHYKENNIDFVLWKRYKPNEPYWSSPWGLGRPGWHIECSVMAEKYLGKNFDIHGGGSDLIFPHHENEIAQSESSNNSKYANYWLHSGILKINDQKMSKSLGNSLSIKNLLKDYHPEVIRYFMTSVKYRKIIEFSTKQLDKCKLSVDKIYNSFYGLNITIDKNNLPKDKDKYIEKFKNAMNDDFNTPLSLSILFTLIKQINKYRNNNIEQSKKYVNLLLYIANILGILLASPEDYFHYNTSANLSKITSLIKDREDAKNKKDYITADNIRNILTSKYNVFLEDQEHGITLWKKY